MRKTPYLKEVKKDLSKRRVLKIVGGSRDGQTASIADNEKYISLVDHLPKIKSGLGELMGNLLNSLYSRRMIVAGNETVEYLSPATMTDMETLAYMIEKHK